MTTVQIRSVVMAPRKKQIQQRLDELINTAETAVQLLDDLAGTIEGLLKRIPKRNKHHRGQVADVARRIEKVTTLLRSELDRQDPEGGYLAKLAPSSLGAIVTTVALTLPLNEFSEHYDVTDLASAASELAAYVDTATDAAQDFLFELSEGVSGLDASPILGTPTVEVRPGDLTVEAGGAEGSATAYDATVETRTGATWVDRAPSHRGYRLYMKREYWEMIKSHWRAVGLFVSSTDEDLGLGKPAVPDDAGPVFWGDQNQRSLVNLERGLRLVVESFDAAVPYIDQIAADSDSEEGPSLSIEEHRQMFADFARSSAGLSRSSTMPKGTTAALKFAKRRPQHFVGRPQRPPILPSHLPRRVRPRSAGAR